MSWRHKLAFKYTVWVGCSLVLFTALAAVVASRALERRSMERMIDTGNWFSDTVKRATRHAMLKDHREHQLAILEAIGRQKGVELIRLYNKQGMVVYSSLPGETGTTVSMQAGACACCHQEGPPSRELHPREATYLFTMPSAGGPDPQRVLGVVNPIYTERACYTDPCHAHPKDTHVLGVLEVGLSTAGVALEVSNTYRQVLIYALFVCLAIAALLITMTHFLLNRPLSKLADAAGHISQGDYDQPLDHNSQDEIGQLAQAFEKMRLSIKEKTRDLKQSRQQFQTMFEEVPCHISVQDKDFKLVAVNRKFAKDFKAAIGDYCYRTYKGLDHKCLNCAVEKSFRDGKVHSSEDILTSADGSQRHLLYMTAPILDAKGDISAVMEMGTDVTEIKHLQSELVKSEEKYRQFFNNAPNSTFVFDLDTLNILDANDRALDVFGYAKDEILGRPFPDLFEPADKERLQSLLAQRGSYLPRLQMLTKSRSRVMVNLRASIGEYLGRTAVIATTPDISELLAAEEQLVQAAKMATLGEMSAGVAHELNQPLSVLATSARILHKQIKGDACDSQVVGQVAREVAQQVERSTKIINHLREFGRKSEIRREEMDMLVPLHAVFELVGQQLRVHNIKVDMAPSPGMPRVYGDQNRLEQVFINLVINARDSIEEMRLAKPKHEGLITIRSGSAGGLVWVRISDNGAGMPQDVQKRIFEPFFTTKDAAKGTGLGLSISYGIVRDYGGSIEVKSQPGRGSSFTVSLPRVEGEA